MRRMVFGGVAAVICMVLVASIVAGAPNKSLDSEKMFKLVETEDIETQVSFQIKDLEALYSEEMEELVPLILEVLPEDLLEQLYELDEETWINIALEGKCHVNMIVWEDEEVLDIKGHLTWHGSIAVTVDEWPTITLDLKNAQLMFKAMVPLDDADEMNFMANFHINGELIVGLESEKISEDISAHVLVKFDNGEFEKIKVWLPDCMGMVLIES